MTRKIRERLIDIQYENIEDPFHTYIDFFLSGFRQHKIDLFNLELMCEILKGKTC